MGTFLAMSGLQGTATADVEAALAAYAREKGMVFETAEGTTEDRNILALRSEGAKHTILYPSDFMEWDDASAALSRTLRTPVLSMHIHDGDLWMYVLYVDGVETDRFNPVPDYWGEDVSEEELSRWKGDPNVLAKHWPGLKAADVERYLTRWDLDNEDPPKAYSDDEHTAGSDWQLLDFMRKLGLKYPVSDFGELKDVTYRFE
jgi:hypothetical protein